MLKRFNRAVLASVTMLLLAGSVVQAGPGKAKHMHGGEQGKHHGQGHMHDVWVTPPKSFKGMKNPFWNDVEAAARGGKIFKENCVTCHGPNGRGNSEVAKSLDHPPANLTKHFHPGRENADAYLFWRLTKGGEVAPFKKQGSAMPAFEDSLTKEERWSVIAYIYKHITHDGGVHDHPWERNEKAKQHHNDNKDHGHKKGH